ncbi:amidohydrolase family protein [Micromonospora sp. NBC_01796]|uniref:amidohydrolase family protein n=1 Tax=Micromonospora sp. NBC_01796 TaxID=2975987 RepID=UPI002DD7E469|nr:amidohydrolase family protein [Micromonospora sp. NBC_01796]WSA83914.1 amidohydrolase family protein [Micromonospora sp. NBC_01796]
MLFPDLTSRRADIAIRDGIITEIGVQLAKSGDEQTVDVSGHLVLPGFVDTHRHMWLGVLSASSSGVPLFPYVQQINEGHGDPFTTEDVYAGVLWGALQAIHAGVTTVADWAHNLGSPADIDANMRALVDSGIRARVYFGGKASSSGDPGLFEGHAREMLTSHTAAGSGRIGLGLGLRGPSMSSPEETERDFALARDMGLPISIHAGMAGLPGAVEQLHQQGLLGADVNYVHANEFTQREWELIAQSGGTVTATPTVDLTMGLGVHPATGPALSHGIPVGLGADTVAYGPSDLFGEMRLVLATERARANAAPIARGEMPGELVYGHLDLLDVATRGGARVVGLPDLAGEIAVGRYADLITVDLDAPHLDGFDDPVLAAFLSAGPSDVDTVVIDGRVLKRGGKLSGAVAERARELMRASRDRIKARRT